MYCKTCGKEINDNAVICPHCGCSTKHEPDGIKSDSADKNNLMSLLGFILSLVSFVLYFLVVVSIIGLIFSIIGLIQCNQRGERLKGLAITGIILSSVSVIFMVLMFTLVMLGV